MISRRKTLHEEGKYEKFETRIRNSIYALIHELLQVQLSTPFTYCFLLLIESVQFFWFTIHSEFTFLWNVNVASWMRSAVEYFQVDYELRTDSSSIFLVLFYAFWSLQFVMLLLAIVTCIVLAKSKRKTSTVLTYSLKILSVYGLLINHIFALPIYELMLTAIICSDNDNLHGNIVCYQGIYFFHLVMGILGLIMFFITSIGFNLIYVELNPFYKTPFAAPQSKINLFKLLLKIAISLYMILDWKANIVKGFIVVYGVIWLAVLALRYRQTPYYNRNIFRFSIGLESCVLWACIVSIVEAFIDQNGAEDIGLFFLYFGMPFAAYAAISIIDRRTTTYRQLIVKHLNKDTDVEMYLNTIFYLIENRDKPEQKMALEGLLKYHIKHCTKKESDCVCYTLSRDYTKEEEAPEKLWYTWIKSILVDVLEKFPKSARLHILYAYVQREKLNNKYKALFEMMIARDNKPSVEQEFSIYRYKSLIEEEIIEEDSRNSEQKGIDVNVIVHFQNSFVAFQNALENAVELHLEFWRELLENSPGIYKLQSLGSMITHSNEEISDRYKKLNEINPNHIKMLQSYGNFLKNIVNDDVEGQRVLEKADYVIKSSVVNKQFIENDRLKYGENSNTCIITVSGNLNKMGTIKNVNNEITRILGFSKADLIGQNINRIIPKYLSELHDSLMRNYFETSESKIMGQERDVFPLTKKGYIVPCTLMIKVLPDLTNGVRLVGFLNDIENNGFSKNAEFETEEKVHYIVYSGDTGAIHGFTKSCRSDFGLSSSIIYGTAASNDFTMDVIFPELLTFNVEDLKNPAGVTTFIDTSNIQQDYLLAHSESDKSEYEEAEEEEVEEKKYRKANVRAVIVDESVYHNLNMKILKFTEIIDDKEKEMRKTNSAMNGENERDKTQVEKTEQSAVENHDAPPEENVSVSEKESNPSVDNAVDELKQLKDFKALISEKTEPKSIKTLSRALIALIVLLVVIACVELSYKIKQVNLFKNGLTALSQAYQRHNIMANINTQARLLDFLALTVMDQNAYGVNQWTYKNNMINLIDELSTVQFNIMQDTETLSNDGVTTYDSQSITLETQLDTSVSDSTRVYTDSVFQYITAASQMRNASTNDITTCPTNAACQSFYFVRQNGLNSLRIGSEAEAQIFYNYYRGKTDTYNTTFLVIMFMGIALLVISEFILIPIVFSVHKTNNRVLSLFGYIPSNEIEELAAKCEEYMENYLEDHKDRRDYSFEGTEEEEIEPSVRQDNQESSYLEVSQNHDMAESDGQTPNASMQLDVSERVKASPVSVFNGEQKQDNLRVPTGGSKMVGSKVQDRNNMTNMTSSQQGLIPRGLDSKVAKDKSVNINSVKEDDKRKDEADMEAADLAYIKSQKLLNSKDNRRSKVMIQFIGIAVIFFAYFLLDYLWLQRKFNTDTRNNLLHFQLSASRMSDIRYLVAFTLEEIYYGNVTAAYQFAGATTDNYRSAYQTAVQSNTNAITSPSNLDLSGVFSDYLSEFNSYTTGDLCTMYFSPLGEYSDCDSISNGLLTSGITQTVTTIVLNTGDVINNYYTNVTANGGVTSTTLMGYALNSADLIAAQEAMTDLMLPLEQLLSNFESKYNTYLSRFQQQEIIKFVVYIVFCFFVFVVLWLPYRKNLSDKIFRTKGMLNMIPIELITKYKSLNELFTDANILQGVK